MKKNIILKNGLNYHIINKEEKIVSVSWDNISSLTDGFLYIPPSVKDDGIEYTVIKNDDGAFVHWKELNRVAIPKTVKNIGKVAFLGCSNLIEPIFPNNISFVEHIDDMAFGDCSNLRSSTIIRTVQSLGVEVFSGCEQLEGAFFSNDILVIPKGVFSCCANLMNLTIGNQVRDIDEFAFFGCKGLSNVTIPASVKTIGKEAFSNCIKLGSVTFLGNAPEIAKNVFGSNTLIYYREGTKGWTTPTWNGYRTEVKVINL